MDYKSYVKETESPSLNTGIHTKIDSEYRISSIYRRFANAFFEQWGWETFLWCKENIEREYEVKYSADEVINLHTDILANFRS